MVSIKIPRICENRLWAIVLSLHSLEKVRLKIFDVSVVHMKNVNGEMVTLIFNQDLSSHSIQTVSV